MEREEVLADLAATVDYINEITEQSDSLSFEDAAPTFDALSRVAAAVKAAQDLLTTRMLERLEQGGPRVFGDERFERVRKFTERTDHEAVVAAVIAEASHCETIAQAATYAARKMESVYLSKSVVARKGEVDKLSLARNAAFFDEHTGFQVKRTEVKP